MSFIHCNLGSKLPRLQLALFASATLVTCGGGSGSAPEATNLAPTFSQASYEFSVRESTEMSVGTVIATDPDGDAITLSLSGLDTALLSISQAGNLSFDAIPDFETPLDSDGDNRYEVTVSASDGVSSRPVQVRIDVTNDVADDVAAQQTLFGRTVLIGEVVTPDYNRPRTWDDADGDCISDRHEVLIAQHLGGEGAYPLTMSSDGCFVQSGRWLDPYDDIYYYSASDVQIDHVVALYESWVSGLGNLSSEVQRRFANTGSLYEGILPETSHNFLAVGASSNGEKGSSDPTDWMPRNEAYHCTYLKKWVLVKSTNDLLFDEAEFVFIRAKESVCDSESLPELPANPEG